MRKLNREIAVLGATSVGKSALTKRFVDDEFPNEYDPTIFKRYTLQTTTNGIHVDLTLYDTAGLEQHAQVPQQYLKSNGFVLVYSIIDAQSFQIVKDIYDRIADELIQENIPIVLIGNKSDLSDRRSVSIKQGQDLAKTMNASFFETSARTGNSVRDSFVGLLSIIDDHNPGGNGGNGGGGKTNDANMNNNMINNNNINNNINNNNNNTARQNGGAQADANRGAGGGANRPVAAGGQQDKGNKCIIS